MNGLSPFSAGMYASFRSGGDPLYMLMGIFALMGSVTSGDWEFTGYHALSMLAITIFIRPLKDRRPVALADSALCGGITAVSRLVVLLVKGPNLLGYLMALLEGLCASIICYLALSAFPSPKPAALAEKRSDSLAILTILALGGFSGLTVINFKIQTILAMTLTLVAAYLGGPGVGSISGISAGLILSLTAEKDPSLLGLLGIAGLLAGIGGWFGQMEAILGYLAAGLLMSIYASSASAVTGRFVELAISCMFLIFVNSRVAKRLTLVFPVLAQDRMAAQDKSQKWEPYKTRVAAVSYTLGEVGSLFSKQVAAGSRAPESPGPSTSPAPEIIKHVAARVCQGCAQRPYCWETDFGPTFEGFTDLLHQISVQGRLSAQDNQSQLIDRCHRFGELVAELNHWYEMDRLERRVTAMGQETKECLAFQYQCLESLLRPGRADLEKPLPKKSKFRLTIKGGTLAAEGTKAGDMWTKYQLDSGQTLVILTDGMGKGETAAQQSKDTLELMKALLNCGLNYNSSVAFLNSALFLAFRPDSFVAIDCLLIDQSAERAHFQKFGAPPSFIKKQNGNVIVVRGSRPPAGAVNTAAHLTTSEPIAPGDRILLVSDGIFRSSLIPARAEHLIVSRLRRQNDSLEATVKGLLNQGLAGRKPADDVTVVGIQIEGN